MCGKMCGTYGQDDKLLSIFLKGEQEQKTGTQVDRFIVGSPLCYFNEFPSIITTASAPQFHSFSPLFSLCSWATPRCRRAWAVGHSLISMMTCAFSAPPVSLSACFLCFRLCCRVTGSARNCCHRGLLPPIARRSKNIALAVPVVLVSVRHSKRKIITHMPNG